VHGKKLWTDKIKEIGGSHGEETEWLSRFLVGLGKKTVSRTKTEEEKGNNRAKPGPCAPCFKGQKLVSVGFEVAVIICSLLNAQSAAGPDSGNGLI